MECELCEDTEKIPVLESIFDDDSHITSYEETGEMIPCPICRKDFYQESYENVHGLLNSNFPLTTSHV